MRNLLLAVFVLACSFSAIAQNKHPFTFEDMMALKRVEEPVPSPDGKWVLFAAVDVDLKANTKTPHVWVVRLSADHENSRVGGADEKKAGSSTAQDASPSAAHPAPVGMTESKGGMTTAEREIISDQDA